MEGKILPANVMGWHISACRKREKKDSTLIGASAVHAVGDRVVDLLHLIEGMKPIPAGRFVSVNN